jgi:hypothetical protein
MLSLTSTAAWEAECEQLEAECELSAEEILARHGFAEPERTKADKARCVPARHDAPHKTRAQTLCAALDLHTIHDIVGTDLDRANFAGIGDPDKIAFLHLVLLCRQALTHSGQLDPHRWDGGALERGTQPAQRERVSYRSRSDATMKTKTTT